MNAKEKPPDRSANLSGAACGTSGGTNSISDFNSGGAGRQGKIFSLLPEGERNALSAADLTQLAGYRNTRSIRLEIDREREIGFPVLASDNGYFRPAPGPAGIAETRRFLRRQDSRMASNRRTTRLIRKQLRALENGPIDGQQTFFDGGGNGG